MTQLRQIHFHLTHLAKADLDKCVAQGTKWIVLGCIFQWNSSWKLREHSLFVRRFRLLTSVNWCGFEFEGLWPFKNDCRIAIITYLRGTFHLKLPDSIHWPNCLLKWGVVAVTHSAVNCPFISMHAVQDSWCLLGVKKQMEHGWMLQWVVQVGPAVRYRDAHWDGPAPLRAAPRGNGQGVL